VPVRPRVRPSVRPSVRALLVAGTAAVSLLVAGAPARSIAAVGASGTSNRPLPPAAGHDVLPNPHGKPRPSRGAASTVTTPPAPPTPSGLPTGAEALSPYVPQRSCDYREKPGVRAFADMLQHTYQDSGSYGIVNTCLREGSTSEHAEGRAFDWAVSVTNAQQVAEVDAVLRWLFATDSHGNTDAMVRRLGIMYIIWDGHIWGAYSASQGWRPYSCSGTTACHRDHVHFSFGWAGAWQRTSYWTKQIAPTDYGPCVPSGQRHAPVYSAFNATPCPAVPTPPTPTNDREFIEQNLYLVAVSGDSGAAVSVIQRQVGTVADGSYGAGTVAAVRAYQTAHRIPVTGQVAVATWQAFLGGVSAHTVGDYTGDGRADLAIWRPSTGVWWVRGLLPTHWGEPGDVPVPADYSGDGRTDLAIWRPSTATWWIAGRAPVHWGQPGDVPVPADYSGDGRTDLAIWRPSTATWWIAGRAPVHWGLLGDVPVPADYTGDGQADLVVYRPSSGTWWVLGGAVTQWGKPGDVPVPAGYDGDGRTDLAIWRPSTGTWWVPGRTPVRWGVPGDVPVPADGNGDGRAQDTVWRPPTGVWWPLGDATIHWGEHGDVPVGLPAAVRRSSFGLA